MSNIEKKDHPENIIRRIKETIQKGKFGIDFTISKREKNEYLKQKYNINDDKIIEIMMDLETKDFIKKEKSNNLMHPEDIIYVFKKSVLLMPKWIEDAEYCILMKYNSMKSHFKEGITWQKGVDSSRFFAGIAGREQNIQLKAGKVYV